MGSVTTPAVFRKSGGFTLIEVLLSLGILSVVMVALFSLCLTVVTMNRSVAQRVNAMSLVDEQLSELLAAAGGESAFREVGDSSAKAFLLGMRDKMNFLESANRPTDFPYRITLNQEAGVLIYEFMVPASGRRRLGMTEPLEDIMSVENRDPLARGVAVVYLREDAVPRNFLEWADLNAAGGATYWPHSWFPMAGPESTGDGNYMDLLTSPHPDWEERELQNLPLMLSVRYYDNAAAMAADSDFLGWQQGNMLEYGQASVSANRIFLVTSNRFAL